MEVILSVELLVASSVPGKTNFSLENWHTAKPIRKARNASYDNTFNNEKTEGSSLVPCSLQRSRGPAGVPFQEGAAAPQHGYSSLSMACNGLYLLSCF